MRDIRILSTKYAPIMVSSKRNSHKICTTSTSQQSSTKLKPLAVLEYNKGKCGIDYSFKWFPMLIQLEKKLNGIENLVFNFF